MAINRFAVILCSFSDVPAPNLPMSFFTDFVSPGTGGLRDYWYDVSYKQTDLTGSIVAGWFPMKYSFVNDGSDPYKDPTKSVRQAWIDEAKRLASLNGIDLSKFYGVIAVVNANVVDSNSGLDVAVGIGGSWGQINWRWCNKCQALAYGGSGTPGPCPNGGLHDHTGSSNYALALDQPGFPGQDNWRWCQKCQGLNYAGNLPGPCPGTGVHDYSASGDYSLGSGTVGYPGQNGWMWCRKCQGLVYAGTGAQAGKCAAGGVHDTSAGANYTLVSNNENHYNVTFCGHETGHALGLGHSWNGNPETEYGDPWDIMSAMDVKSFSDSNYPPAGPGANAVNLDVLGLLPDFSKWTDVGTITLQALNNPGLALLAVRVTRADRTYYVEYRQPTGWDHAFSGSGVFINELRSWQWCNKCQELTFVAGTSPGPCAAGGVHNSAGSSYYTLLHKTTMDLSGNPIGPGQNLWQWCNKCQALTYAGNASLGPCPGGGSHNHQSSGDYTLLHDTANYGQNDWRWCNKCQALAFAGGSPGNCQAGGTHDLSTSSDYDLMDGTRHSFLLADAAGNPDWQPGKVFVDKDRGLGIVIHSFDTTQQAATISLANIQNDWRWCSKCQGMAYAGNPSPGPCPAGAEHVLSGSADYSLLHDLPGNAGQDNWRWCSKCQGLAYAGNSNGVCPAGGAHSLGASFDYVLLHDSTMADAQSNWRWCSKCQGLAFAGNSQGVCPTGGTHVLTQSSNYNLINV